MPNSKTASKKVSKKTSKKTATKKVSKPKKEPKLTVFCGITQPVPKGHRLGSMKECLDSKQVRYYGLKKIDNKLLDTINVKKETKSELMIKIAGLMGKLTKLKRDLEASKKTEEKKKIIEEHEKVRKEVLFLNDKMKKLK
jgi:hypothetical protein